MFKNGSGVAQSDVEAVRWFRKAADQSYADAQYVLGLMFRIGCGVNQSDTEAARWFKKAADQGHAEAKRRL
jgi:TPR repeat protein